MHSVLFCMPTKDEKTESEWITCSLEWVGGSNMGIGNGSPGKELKLQAVTLKGVTREEECCKGSKATWLAEIFMV